MSYTSRTLPTARISRSAIQQNLATIRERAGENRILPLVDLSGDALGAGAVLIAELAEAAGFVGVTDELGGRLFAPGDGVILVSVLGARRILGAELGFVPALQLVGEVLAVKSLLAGEGVSYGYRFRAEHDTRVALVTGGYAQGIVRSLGGQLSVSINGLRHRIVGRVAMDVCVVDIGDADIERGAEVVFLGDPSRGEPSLQEWIEYTGMQAEELIAPLGLRSNREVVA